MIQNSSRTVRLGFILCLLCLFCFLFSGAFPVQAGVPTRVLLIDLPRFTFEDLSPSYPHLFQMATQSAGGVLASRTSGVITPEKLYLNFNSGKQLWATEDARLIYNVNEIYQGSPAGQLYHALTGFRPGKDGGVFLGFPQTLQLNLKNEADPAIGTIGDILHRNSIKTAVIGNADSIEYPNRSGATMLVDKNGLIDLAAVGQDTIIADSRFPSGYRSNTARILAYYQRFASKARIVQITLGDLERVERYREYLTETRWAYFRREALRNYDELIARLLHATDSQATLVVLFSILPPDAKQGKSPRLNPVFLHSKEFNSGLIYSDSTRQAALVTTPDLLTTIFSFLGTAHEPGFPGRTLKRVNGDWHRAASLRSELDQNYLVRWPLLTVYGYSLIALVLMAIFGLVFWRDQNRFFTTIYQIYLFLLTFPAVFLLEAIPSPTDWIGIAAWTLGLAGLMYWLILRIGRGSQEKSLVALCAITVSVIMLDGIAHNGLLELRSFWGYSAVAAARFYGVGNEYLGFLLGAYIVLITLSHLDMQRNPQKILWGSWLGITVFFFYPFFGTNIGGGITALVGLGIANFLWLGQSVRRRQIIFLGGSLIIITLLAAFCDLWISGNQMSHFGQFLQSIHEQGLSVLVDTFLHKWELNLSLIAFTGWSYVLIALLLGIPLVYKMPPTVVAPYMNAFPLQTKSVLSIAITALIALVVNDSGIVTVATIFIFGFEMFLLWIIKHQAREMISE